MDKIRFKRLFLKNLFFSGIAILFLSYAAYCLAAMGSTNYEIPADTVNSGGNSSSSANYKEGDTVGEAAIGVENSANYSSKTAFWYMIPGGVPYSLKCDAALVYMMDYTLGDPNDYSKYLFSATELCTFSAVSGVPWNLTIQSSNMTSAKNNLASSNVYLTTDGSVKTGDTVTTISGDAAAPVPGVTEPSTSDYALNAPKTVVQGNASAVGTYDNRPTIKLKNLNTLFSQNITGTLTITIQ